MSFRGAAPRWRRLRVLLRTRPGIAASVAFGFALVLARMWAHGGILSAPLALSIHAPNCPVLLISIDTLRAVLLGCYGYRRPTSPNIDRLATEGVLFENNINTGGGTLPVHASMFTSLPPSVHGVWSTNNRSLGPDRITLAGQLRERGYHTRGYTGGGFVRHTFGLATGFDFFYDEGGDFQRIMPMLNSWLDTQRGDRFFLFLHTYNVHSAWNQLPYDAPDGFNSRFTGGYHGKFNGCEGSRCASQLFVEYNQRVERHEITPQRLFSAAELAYVVGLYDGTIAYVDRELGRLFERLKSRGLYDRMLIVFTADHGEEFLDHNRLLHDQNYEEEARIPLIVRFPHAAFRGRRVSEQVSTLEVMPTILDVLDIPANPEVQGKSVVPLLLGDRTGRDAVYVGSGAGPEKLRTPQWSLITYLDRPLQLFDLVSDPHEQHDILPTHPDRAVTLVQRLVAERRNELQRAQSLLALRLLTNPRLSAAERAQLRSLGYLR
jgi:arylsulfatase A-like enzyme